MKKFRITIINKGEASEIYEWNSIPRKGEIIETGRLNYRSKYEVTNVVHYFGHGMDSEYAEIGLEVAERK
ncbi:MAG TPA: hypothetical protein VHY30_05190 [Verrucomicrobiae bacterium]|jgi:hypothetical protein|nr:hypothetical protein [Verrucomicrobiae bacterium]